MKLKIVLIIILVIIFLPMSFILGSATYLLTEGKRESFYDDNYYKLELYNSFDDSVFMKIFYYNNTSVEVDNLKYKLGRDNIEKVKNYIDDSSNKLHKLNNNINIDFDYDSITENDAYLSIEENEDYYYFQYYDMDENVLYEVFCSR